MTLYLDSLPTCVTGPDQVPATADPEAGGLTAGDGFVSGSATEGVCCAVAGGVCCAAGGCVPWVGGGSRGHLFSKFPCCAPAATTSGPALIAIKAATQFRNVIFSTHAVQTYARLEKRPYWDRWGMTRCLARGRAGCSILGEREAERPEATPRQRPLGLSRATFYMESSRTA